MLDVMTHLRKLIPGADLTPGEGSFWGTGRPFTAAYGRRMAEELGFQTGRPATEQFERMIERVKRNRDLVARHYGL
jgi:hypothetical protein